METQFINADKSFISKEINNDGKNYICKIGLFEELIKINLFLDDELKYKGYIFLEKIQTQIKAFFDYNIYEIYDEINQLNSNNFTIIKENNKYKLKIELMILRKKKNIIIDLNENKINEDIMNDKINNYENIIKEKDNIIFELKEKIKKLIEKESMKENNIKEDYNNNFSINSKKPLNTLNFHSNSVNCLAILNDERLVSGSDDNNIIIYNLDTYKPDIIIKDHKGPILYITKLSTGMLASCSQDKTIKLFEIKGNKYELIKSLSYHEKEVFKIIELNNKNLVSSSNDNCLIFYIKDKSNIFKKDYKENMFTPIYSLIQIKDNEICFSTYKFSSKKNVKYFFMTLFEEDSQQVEEI